MASEVIDLNTVVAEGETAVAKTALIADGVLDNLVASVKVPFTDADYVEKSVALTGMIVTGVIGLAGGIALEARGVNIPLVSELLRPKS